MEPNSNLLLVHAQRAVEAWRLWDLLGDRTEVPERVFESNDKLGEHQGVQWSGGADNSSKALREDDAHPGSADEPNEHDVLLREN